MNYRVFRVLSPFCLLLLLLCGCQGPLLTLMVLFKGTDVEPPYTFLRVGDKKVAVVCRSMAADQLATQNVPRDLARRVGDMIHTRVKNKKLKVVESTKVDAWLDNCDNVFSDFLEIGRDPSIAADYVIGIDLVGFRLRDSHSPHLLQGKAQLQVRAFDCKTGEVVANKTLDVTYPPNIPIATGPGIDQPFRDQFLHTISEQVAILFVPYDPHKTRPMDANTLELQRF